MKAETILACLGLCAVVAVAGCASEGSQSQYSRGYDPNNPDKLAATLPLDPLYPSGPLPLLPSYYWSQPR